MTKLRAAAFLAGVFLLLLLSACREIPTSVKVGAGPSLSLGGSGRLASLTIYAPQVGQKIAFPDHDVATAVWQITATKGYFKGSRVKGLQLIYGKVPEGYQQIVPDKSPAPPLSSGIVYAFFAETTDAPISTGYFYMGGSGPVQTEIPDLCLMFVQGRKTRVKCKLNTAELYQEPVDLEKYVREHQVP